MHVRRLLRSGMFLLSQCYIALERQNLSMHFACAVSGVPGCALLNSGAKVPFISEAYARRVGLKAKSRGRR